jgi:hypothetical protein
VVDGGNYPRFHSTDISVIIARTDQGSISFGEDFPYDELKYLHALLYEALTAQPASRLAP